MGMLEDLTELLIDQGINMDDVVRGPFTDTPDDQTALIPAPSSEPPFGYCGTLYEIHRVAVQVRRKNDDVVLRADENYNLRLALTSLLGENVFIEPSVSFRLNGPGDAVSFVDPLSSAGVRKALVSGWRAAVGGRRSSPDSLSSM